MGVAEPLQEGPDARREEALRAERTVSYVSTQGRLTTPQMAVHGRAPSRSKTREGPWISSE